MKRYLTFSIGFLIIALDSCIEPFNISLPAQEESIVVDGEITDEPGPYTIKLYKTAAIEDQFEKLQWISNAHIVLKDDLGNEELFYENIPGHYSTNGMGITGQVGRTYYIKISTQDGAQYESIPEKLLPVGEINNLYHEFVQKEDPSKSKHINTTNGFNLFVDSELLPEQNGLVRWRWKSTFEILTYPQFKTKPEYQGRAIVIVPNPPSCSGYVRRGNNAVQVDDCYCCVCWIDIFNKTPVLPKSGLIKSGSLNKNQVAFIPASRRYFHKKFHIEVEQLSVSQRVFDFWKKVESQKASGSDLFQTPPPATAGNIKTLTDGSIPARGIFSASSVKRKSIFLYKEDIPYYLPKIDTLKESCLKIYFPKDANSTTVKPIFW